MIRLEDVEFRYPRGEFGLQVAELRVARGSSLALIGPSGCGKTTLLRLVAGILIPDRGRIVTAETNLAELAEAQRRDFRIRRIGMVFQEFELLEYLSVLENVLLPLRLGSGLVLDAAARDRARQLAERVGLAGKLRQLPGRLSQGERQRVAVCRALVTRPELLLADEPTGNLDPRNKGRVIENLIEFAADEGATLVVVTHDHGLLDRFDRVVDFETFHVAGGGAEAHEDG